MNRKDDPYFDQKVYHRASLMSDNGDVSALCYAKPRAINLKRGMSWTLVDSQVTCPKCRKMIAARAARPEGHSNG